MFLDKNPAIKCHVYNIPGVSNMRDLGGYTAKDGKKIVMGRFIRSTALARLGEAGVDELLSLGVDCVIDLRSGYERRNEPDVIETHDAIHFTHVPMLDYISSNFANGDFADFPKSMQEMYIGLIDNAKDSFKAVFELFADERFEHYLFHCTAGKDRTGVTGMLLLGLAGIPDEIIIEDYSYTEILIEPVPIHKYPHDLPRYLFESSPETMRAALDHLYEKYGSVPAYLTSIGIDADKQNRILQKLFSD